MAMGYVKRLLVDSLEIFRVIVFHHSHSKALLVAQELVSHVILVSILTSFSISEAATSAPRTETSSHMSILREEELRVRCIGVVSIWTHSSIDIAFSIVLLHQLTHPKLVERKVLHILTRQPIQIYFGSDCFGSRFPTSWRTRSTFNLCLTFSGGGGFRSCWAWSLPGFYSTISFALNVIFSHGFTASSHMLNIQIFWYVSSPYTILWQSRNISNS